MSTSSMLWALSCQFLMVPPQAGGYVARRVGHRNVDGVLSRSRKQRSPRACPPHEPPFMPVDVALRRSGTGTQRGYRHGNIGVRPCRMREHQRSGRGWRARVDVADGDVLRRRGLARVILAVCRKAGVGIRRKGVRRRRADPDAVLVDSLQPAVAVRSADCDGNGLVGPVMIVVHGAGGGGCGV